jgi:hypothetical protein
VRPLRTPLGSPEPFAAIVHPAALGHGATGMGFPTVPWRHTPGVRREDVSSAMFGSQVIKNGRDRTRCTCALANTPPRAVYRKVYIWPTSGALQPPDVGCRNRPACRVCTWIRRPRMDFASSPPSGKNATGVLDARHRIHSHLGALVVLIPWHIQPHAGQAAG